MSTRCQVNFTAGSSRTPSRLACRTRAVWRYRPVPSLSGLLPPFPAPPRSGCPQLHRPAATGPMAESFHLRPVVWRLAARGDLPLQLHHAQVALGLVVGERHTGILQPPQDLVTMGMQPGPATCPPARGGPVAASAAPDRGATAAALSAADQRRWLAGGGGSAGRAGAGGVRPRAARPCRGGHGGRRRGRAPAWRATRARAGGALARLGARWLLVDADRAAVRAVAGVAGPAALAASDRVAGRLECDHVPRWGPEPGRPAATALRGGPADQLGRLGDAVDGDHPPDVDPGGRAVHAGAGGR